MNSSKTLPKQPPAPPSIWWGHKGDTENWEKAKVVMENYEWVVLSQDEFKKL